MKAQDYWKLFIETGVPEYYLLYSRMTKMEAQHVSDNSGPGAPGHGLQ